MEQTDQSNEEKPIPLEGEEASVPQCEEMSVGAQETEVSKFLGSGLAGDEEEDSIFDTAAAAGDDAVREEVMEMAAEEAEPSADVTRSGGKRKRGRPPRAQSVRPPAKKKGEEDVCFICFDGGNLVVCDRRGCPKVYHPACVNRDEAFFQSRGRWNCGWHICSICEKAAHYMCYTCTYSLCKGCIKEAGFVCVRGNKGFCETCYSTVMLIESKEHANEGKIGVDFDDKNSFEYLFKDYWFILKGKLSLTLEELNSAKSPWKRSAGSAGNEESSDDLYNANDDQGASSDSSSGRREGSTSSRKKVRRRPRATAAEESCVQQVDSEGASMPEDTEWASKELLEFVAHMKGGDKSVLSQFDVQALLLEYIKQNNLRDPRRKSQIICDPRLENLFGKARVGHFEMLKLLESHFLIKEASQVVTDDNQGGVLDPDSGQMDAEGYSDAATKMSSDKRRKNRKKVEEREPQTNLDDYAAVDVHNISLIYLRRNLMEDFLDDVDNFNEKVVGSFVRIRISGMGQRQDMYRLVQVVGTPKAAEKYKTGRKMTDFTLEILNLNKTEVITIDSISNQEFTEEECKRLRQSIKCGLISRLTVGDVQEKARVFQAVRVNDWLESEKLRLGHLRDRASEKGRRKELRECVEKLQLLSSPEERRRRLNEVPEIHVDPNMDPDYESADEGESDDKNQDNFSRSREPSSLRKGREGISPGRGGSTSSNNWGAARKSSITTWESNRNTRTEGARDKAEAFTSVGDRTNEPSWNQGKDVRQTNTWETPTNLSNATGLEAGVWNNNQPATEFEQSYGVAPETMTSLPSDTSEHEKIWHYKDPSGKIQGPFSMTQLRKWSTTGYFPDDLRIWRVSEKQEDSILLADALIGKFGKDLPQWEPPQSNFSQPTTFAAGMDSRANEREGGWRGENNPAFVDSKQNRGNWSETVNTELPNADRLASHSSTWSAPRTEMVDPREVISGISPRGWEPSRDTSAWSGQPQAHSSPRPTPSFSGNPYGPTSYQGSGGLGGGNVGRWNRGQDRRSNWSSNSPRASWPSGQGYDMQHSNWGSPGQQSSRPQWGNDSFNLPTTPQPSSGGWTSAQGAMNTAASPTPVQHMGSGWATPPSTGINGTHKSPAATMEHGRWGSNSASMPNMANQMAETNAAQVPQRVDVLGESLTSNQQTEAPNVLESHSAVVPRDEVIPSCNPTVLGGSSRNELSVGICKNQFFDSDCPSPTPRSERQELAAVQSSELDPGKKWPEANDSRRSDPAFAVPALEMSDPPASHRPENDNLKSVFSTSSEDVQNLPNSRSLSSETQDNLSPIRDMQDKPIHPVLNTEPTAGSNALEAVSTQSSEGLAPASAQKQDPNGWSHSPAPSGHEWEQNQIQKPKPSLARPEPMKIGNLEGTPDAMRGDEWSLPSPTPATKPSGWNACADPSSGISQNNPWVSSGGSRPPESSQPHAGTPIELAQPSQPGWGTGAKDASSSGWGVSPQNLNSGAGSAQGNPNTGWGSVIQGNTDAGWGTIARGNVNVAWGTAAQGNANLNAGWGTPAVQGSTNPNTGWGTPQQVNPNPNTGWVTPAQGKTHPNAGWGMPSQGNINPSTGWGTPSEGNTNPNAGWGAAAQGDATNPGWGQPTPENANPNSGWGTAIQQNANWGTGQGNTNGWESRQNRSGDRYGGSHGGDSRYDSRHGGGRNQRNDKMHRDREGGASRPPLRGGGQGQGGQRGVCKFHESGYCKKGASCNYLHS